MYNNWKSLVNVPILYRGAHGTSFTLLVSCMTSTKLQNGCKPGITLELNSQDKMLQHASIS